jgi:hypothetical protein
MALPFATSRRRAGHPPPAIFTMSQWQQRPLLCPPLCPLYSNEQDTIPCHFRHITTTRWTTTPSTLHPFHHVTATSRAEDTHLSTPGMLMQQSVLSTPKHHCQCCTHGPCPCCQLPSTLLTPGPIPLPSMSASSSPSSNTAVLIYHVAAVQRRYLCPSSVMSQWSPTTTLVWHVLLTCHITVVQHNSLHPPHSPPSAGLV